MGITEIVLALEFCFKRIFHSQTGSVVFADIVEVTHGIDGNPRRGDVFVVGEVWVYSKDDGKQVVVRAINTHKIHREPTLVVEVLGVRVDQLRGDRFDGNPTAGNKGIKFDVVFHGFNLQGILQGCLLCILERVG